MSPPQQEAATTPITTYGQGGFLFRVGRQFLGPVMMMFDDDDGRGDSDGDNQKEKSSQPLRKNKKRRRRRVAMCDVTQQRR